MVRVGQSDLTTKGNEILYKAEGVHLCMFFLNSERQIIRFICKDKLTSKIAGFYGFLTFMLRLKREKILSLARDVPFASDVLRSHAHMETIKGISQTILSDDE